jgi:hypothetical protein
MEGDERVRANTSTRLTTFQPCPGNGGVGAGRCSGRVWVGVGKGISRGRARYGQESSMV